MSATLYREFVLSSKPQWNAFVSLVKANAKALLERGTPIRLIVTTDEKKRNTEQNKRLWGYVYETIAAQAWVNGRQFSKEVWHEYFARQYGVCDELMLPDGELIIKRKSTTNMTVGEFSDFMQKVEAHAASELGVVFE